MVKLSCACLNISIHIVGTRPAAVSWSEILVGGDNDAVRAECRIRSLGVAELGAGVSSPVLQELVAARTIPTAWTAFSCLSCGADVYLLNAAKPNLVFLNLAVLLDPEAQQRARASENFSPFAQIVVRPDAGLPLEHVPLEEVDAVAASQKLFQREVLEYLERERAAMQQRILAFINAAKEDYRQLAMRAQRDQKELARKVQLSRELSSQLAAAAADGGAGAGRGAGGGAAGLFSTSFRSTVASILSTSVASAAASVPRFTAAAAVAAPHSPVPPQRAAAANPKTPPAPAEAAEAGPGGVGGPDAEEAMFALDEEEVPQAEAEAEARSEGSAAEAAGDEGAGLSDVAAEEAAAGEGRAAVAVPPRRPSLEASEGDFGGVALGSSLPVPIPGGLANWRASAERARMRGEEAEEAAGARPPAARPADSAALAG